MHKDFKVFLQAVRDAPIEKVLRRTEELRRLRELEQQVSSLSQSSWAPPSPMSRMTQKFTSTSLNNPGHSSYTRPSSTPQPPKPPAPNNPPIQTTTGANPSTPYIPPFRRQTPPHTLNPIHQQFTPANPTPNPFDDTATLRPNNSFYQRLQQQTSPLAHKGSSQQLARSAAQLSRLYPDSDIGH